MNAVVIFQPTQRGVGSVVASAQEGGLHDRTWFALFLFLLAPVAVVENIVILGGTLVLRIFLILLQQLIAAVIAVSAQRATATATAAAVTSAAAGNDSTCTTAAAAAATATVTGVRENARFCSTTATTSASDQTRLLGRFGFSFGFLFLQIFALGDDFVSENV